MDLQKQTPFGFAFVNLSTHETAAKAKRQLAGLEHGFEVEWSAQQGLAIQIERYRNSSIMHESVPEDFKPMLVRNGHISIFPAPTVEIKAPSPEGNRAQKRAACRARKAAKKAMNGRAA